MNYSELEKLKATDYLNPEKFVTQYDKDDNYAEQQYKYGLEIGSSYGHILINDRSVWSAGNSADTGVLSSSEGIGYHRATKELLSGFLDSGAQIEVKRYSPEKGFESFMIQKGDPVLLNQVNKLCEKNYIEKGFETVLMKPLNSRPLSSQVNDAEVGVSFGDLEYDKENYTYFNKENKIAFVLSNYDISKQHTHNRLVNEKIVENGSSNMVINTRTKEFSFNKSNHKECEFLGFKVDVYLQPKQTEKDQQRYYYKVDRRNLELLNEPSPSSNKNENRRRNRPR